MAAKSVHLYQKLSLSRFTVYERIKEISQDIKDNHKNADKFVNFSLCLNETTDIKNIGSWQYFFEG